MNQQQQQQKKKKTRYLLAVAAMFCAEADAFAFPVEAPSSSASWLSIATMQISSKRRQQQHSSWTSLNMQRSSTSKAEEKTSKQNNKKKRRLVETLSASFVSDDDWSDNNNNNNNSPFKNPSAMLQDLRQATSNKNQLMETTLLPVLTTSLMITGNTVGAGMLVLPELAAGPGMGISTVIFTAAFLINLISGLVIAEVAIHQHDTSGDDVPSSFKEFAQANLPQWGRAAANDDDDNTSTSADLSANLISGISVMVNALVLAFNTAKVGDFGAETLSSSSGMALPAEAVSIAWVVACVALVGTQTFTSLSTITSVLVFGLFASFAGLLLPGLAHLTTSPMDLLLHTPGTSPDVWASACQLAPIVLMSLVYQNIVPTVTKMLDYDRSKSVAAITLGSFLPFGMYVAWAFCVVGGGTTATDSSGILDGPLMTLFTLTTIAGSSIGCVMSLAEEFDTFVAPSKIKSNNSNELSPSADDDDDEKFSFQSVLLSVACAGVSMQFFADHDLNGALKVAGSFGSPLLYGVLPVVMAYTQRQKRSQEQHQQQALLPSQPAPPLALELPNASLGLLGVASTGFVGNELFQSAQDVIATVML